MKIQAAIVAAILLLWLAACAPAAPVQENELPETGPTQLATTTVEEEIPSPVLPTETLPALATEVTETQGEAAAGTPAPTLTAWEEVQRTVETYRNRLERGSDGYEGLNAALEQTEPNQAWCGGLNAAIGDFSYANDEESAQALRDLQEAQGCG